MSCTLNLIDPLPAADISDEEKPPESPDHPERAGPAHATGGQAPVSRPKGGSADHAPEEAGSKGDAPNPVSGGEGGGDGAAANCDAGADADADPALATLSRGGTAGGGVGGVGGAKKRRKGPQRGSPKRRAWSVAEKRDFCLRFREGNYRSQAKFIRELNAKRPEGDKVSLTSFQAWWSEVKKGTFVLDELTLENEERKKKRRRGKFEIVEARLSEYVHQCRESGQPDDGALSETALQMKAMQIAVEVGAKNFKASNGWLWKFCDRHGLRNAAESCEKVVTSRQVREALFVLSTYAAEANSEEFAAEFALDVARLHHKLAKHERVKGIMIPEQNV